MIQNHQDNLRPESEPPRLILMLDDSSNDYQRIEHLLADHGIRVDWAPTIEVATEMLSTAEYAAVLVDYRLGARSGLDIFSEPAFVQAGRPAIILTGFDDRDVDASALELGAVAFLSKDEVTGPLLARTIRYAAHATEARTAKPTFTAKEIRLQVALASGMSVKDAAAAADLTLRTAYRRIATDEFQEALEKIQEQIAARLIEQAIDNLT